MALEPLNFGSVLVDDSRVRALEFRDEFEAVVHFDVVAETREELDGAARSVAVVVACFEVGAVLELLRDREIEELFADGELSVYFGLGEAEVRDVEEALRVS
jgi:hypothetical protein